MNRGGVEDNKIEVEAIEVQASCLLQMLEGSSSQDQTTGALHAAIIYWMVVMDIYSLLQQVLVSE